MSRAARRFETPGWTNAGEPRLLARVGQLGYTPVNHGDLAMAFYELRQYKIFPGKMDDWLRFMEETIIPFQISKGMVITASFRGEQDESIYVWMRRFESEEQRQQLYDAVYQSERWKNEISPRVSELMDRSAIQVTRLVPSSKSPVQ
jgi:hypothetical protein